MHENGVYDSLFLMGQVLKVLELFNDHLYHCIKDGDELKGKTRMKIAFVDIDGTVLDYSRGMNEPTERCLKAFQAFRNQGNLLIIATSRTKLVDGLDASMFDGFVFSNGQYIAFKDKVLKNNIFTKEQIILQQDVYTKHQGGAFYSGISGQWISPTNIDLSIAHMVHYGLDPNKVQDHFLAFVLDEIEATAATATFRNMEDMRAAQFELPQDWEIHAYYDERDLRMDVHLPGVTKGSSCMFLVEHANLKREDSYAFGDGMNDIEMLGLVGHGVAMGNADPRVKAIADTISDDALEDGLAKAFERLFSF